MTEMLRKIKNVLQDSEGLRKSWYTTQDMDLFVWVRMGTEEVVSFQICYECFNYGSFRIWSNYPC